MKYLLKVFLYSIIFSSLILITSVIAQSDGGIASYSKAYDTCSPTAAYQTERQCSYASVVENYYQSCMTKLGFSGENELNDQQYEKYISSHKDCLSGAEYDAKKYCNYGSLYKSYYDECMLKFGYDGAGEYIGKPDVSSTNKEGQEYMEFDF